MSDPFDLLVDLHIDGERQGPGSDEATRRAIALAGLGGPSGVAMADIGCGISRSPLVLIPVVTTTAIEVTCEVWWRTCRYVASK